MTTDTPYEESENRGGLSLVETLLAALWIVLPAVQYVGTVQRTKAVLARETPSGAMARLDLLPWYIVLLGLTLVYITFKVLAGRSPASIEKEDEAGP